MSDLATFAKSVDDAQCAATAIERLSIKHAELSVEDAYEIQRLSIARRVTRGERRVGVKISQADADGISWGCLTDAMILEEGATLEKSNYLQPQLKPGIVFLLNKPLSGRVTALQAMSAIEAIAPAINVVDSRYKESKSSFVDFIADNASISGLVIGTRHSPEVDFSNLGMVLSVNGRPVQIGSSAAIFGNPVRSLVAAAKMVAQTGETLQPGDIVMAGGAAAAHPASVDETITLDVQNLGSISISIDA